MLTDQICSTQSKAILPAKLIMPITWTNENVSRLFLVTLAVHHIHMDYKQIAQAFGGDATPRAIEEKMKKLRKEAREFTDGAPDSIPVTRRGRGAGRGGFKAAVTCTPGRRRGRKPKYLKELEAQQAQQALEKQTCAERGDDEELRQSCLPETPQYGDLMADHLLKKAQVNNLKVEEQDHQDDKTFHHNYQHMNDGTNLMEPVLERIHFHNSEKYEEDDVQNTNIHEQYEDDGNFEDKLDPLLRYPTLHSTDLSDYTAQVFAAYPQGVMTLNDTTVPIQSHSPHPTAHFSSYDYPVAYVPYKELCIDENYETDNGRSYDEMKLNQIQDKTIVEGHDQTVQDSFYHTSDNYTNFEVDRFDGTF